MDEQVIYGIHTVQAVLEKEPEKISAIWFEKTRRDARIQVVQQLAKQAGLDPQFVTREALDEVCGHQKHQGVAAQSRLSQALGEKDLLSFIEGLGRPPFLLILDGVTDPHNLGACLRSADGAGVDAVIVPRDKACGLTPVVRKVASGAAESVPFFQVTNLARTLRDLQEAGVWLIGLAGEAELSLYETDLKGAIGIVLGAEGQGMRRLTREHCDHLAHLPMLGQVESLNVSVATGICLYEALRQRRQTR